jgi:hypothetical protein
MIPKGEGGSPRPLKKYGYEDLTDKYSGQYILLHAGETAFLSTIEEFRMPLDTAAIIALRPKFARQGIILLSGQYVDPGYGILFSGENRPTSPPSWDNDGTNRLFFAIANIGDSDVKIGCEAPMLSAVFMKVAGADSGPAVPHPRKVTQGTEIIKSTIGDENFTSTSLSLLSAFQDSRVRVEELEQTLLAWSAEREQRDGLFFLALSLIVGTIFSISLATLLSLASGSASFKDLSIGAGIAALSVVLGGIAIGAVVVRALGRRKSAKHPDALGPTGPKRPSTTVRDDDQQKARTAKTTCSEQVDPDQAELKSDP